LSDCNNIKCDSTTISEALAELEKLTTGIR